LYIDYEEIKESRKVVAIKFLIKKNNSFRKTEIEKLQDEKSRIIQKEMRSESILIGEIMEYGFSRLTAKKFLQQNSEEIVRNALKSVNVQLERGNVKNPKAMLRTAVQKNWKPDVYLSKKLRSRSIGKSAAG
jgi:plasmid replication initiation protein